MTTTTRNPRTRWTTTPTTVDEWAKVLSKTEVGTDAQAEAMTAVRSLGASYATLAAAMGVAAMSADPGTSKWRGGNRLTSSTLSQQDPHPTRVGFYVLCLLSDVATLGGRGTERAYLAS
jgi:hypothetical protein